MKKVSTLKVDHVNGRIDRLYENGVTTLDIGTLTRYGYRVVNIGVTNKFHHRLIWESVYGVVEDGAEIDHINGNRSDNRIANLRLVVRSQNNQNTRVGRRGRSHDMRGVTYNHANNNWRVRISVNYTTIEVGSYISLDDAKKAYAKAAAIHHTHNPVTTV